MGHDKFSLSTDHLTRVEGLSRWRECLAEVYCRQDVHLLQQDLINGRISSRTNGDLIFSSFRSGGAQRVTRTKEMARADKIEHFHFAIPLGGKYFFRQGEMETCAVQGDVFVINASAGFSIDFSADAEGLVVAVPCDIMRKRTIGIDDFIAHNNLSNPLLVSMMANISASILHIESDTSEGVIQEFCIDLLDLSISEARARLAGYEAGSNRNRELAERVRVVIRERLSDQSFGLLDAATACGISKRLLQRVMFEQATTFGQELLSARLTRAAHLLMTRSRSSMSIGQIARYCGFASQSHFSSSYRECFGRSPREDQRSR